MQLKIFLPLLVVFLTAQKADAWCVLCPDSSLLSASKTKQNCHCTDAYYDSFRQECTVSYFNCTIFRSISDALDIGESGSVFSDILGLLKHDGNDFSSLIPKSVGNMIPLVKGALSKISLGDISATALDKTKFGKEYMQNGAEDLAVIRKIVKNRLGNVALKLAEKFQSIFNNPYYLKPFLEECKGDQLCLFQKVLVKNHQMITKSLPPFISQISDEMILVLDDIQKVTDKCERNKCQLLRKIVKNRGVLTLVLKEVKEFREIVAESLVNAFEHIKEMGTQVLRTSRIKSDL